MGVSKERPFLEKCLDRMAFEVNFLLAIVIPCLLFKACGYLPLLGFYGIGDNVYRLHCLDEYKGQKKIVVFCNAKNEWLFRLYRGVDRVFEISSKMYGFLHSRPQCLKRISRFRLGLWVADYSQDGSTPFLRTRKCYGLGPETRSMRTFPLLPSGDPLFVPKRKSILIIPDSVFYHSSKIDQRIAKEATIFAAKGYSIYVNSPRRLPGFPTKAVFLFPSCIQLAFLARQVERVVGIRTGLLDFIVSTNSANTIVCYYDRRVCDLLSWGYSLKLWGAEISIKEVDVND